MISYVALLMLALAINAGDTKMLALSAVIGAGIFVPVPDHHFYLLCSAGEILIALIACCLNVTASSTIIRISILLTIFHLLGYLFNGYPAGSPYHLLVKVFEHSELLACILLSGPIIRKINHGKN